MGLSPVGRAAEPIDGCGAMATTSAASERAASVSRMVRRKASGFSPRRMASAAFDVEAEPGRLRGDRGDLGEFAAQPIGDRVPIRDGRC